MLHNAGIFILLLFLYVILFFLFKESLWNPIKSALQVKQRKKSSNKWTCVVCNQKQSVLKVFAQGPMAKDLRKFVQSFNMSRKFADQNQPFDPPLEYDINFEDDDGGDMENPKKRRNDWTEYLDPEDHHDHKLVLQEEEQGRIYLEDKLYYYSSS